MDELITAILLEEEEDDKLLVFCMSDGAKGNFSKNYYSLLGRCLMDSEMKFRKFFGVSRDIFQSVNFSSNSSL
jgi:hypothetical protein